MKTTTERGFVAGALIIVVAAMLVTGGVYIYSKSRDNAANDALIENAQSALRSNRPPQTAIEIYAQLAWEKTRLKMETNKLSELLGQAKIAQTFNESLRQADREIKAAIAKTDKLFGDTVATTPDIQIKTPSVVLETKINETRADITEILAAWQALITAPATPQNTAALDVAITHDLPIVQSFIQDLTTTVNNLTPANSGLTAAEIAAYQATIAAAAQEVANAAANLAAAEQAQNNPQAGTPTTNNPGQDPTIQQQQEIINQIQEQIHELEQQAAQNQNGQQGTQTNNQPINQIEAVTQASTSYSGYTGSSDTVIQSTSGEIIYPPNPAPIRRIIQTEGPDLIQGDNM